jgi:hypothetical protein
VFLAMRIQNKFNKVPASLVLTRITYLDVNANEIVGERLNNSETNISIGTADQITQTIGENSVKTVFTYCDMYINVIYTVYIQKYSIYTAYIQKNLLLDESAS